MPIDTLLETNLKDQMARAVYKEVLANPGNYPATLAHTDLDPEANQYETDGSGLPSNAVALEKATAEGLSVVYPLENELQIDIDNEQSYLFFQEKKRILHRFVGILNEEEHPSKSGLPKRHITLTLETPVTVLERICLQACLGSDRVREILGYVRYKNDDPTPTLFFEKKES